MIRFNRNSRPRTGRLALRGLALAAALLVSACTSFQRGAHDKLMVETIPSGANVRLSSGETGVSPVSFTLSRKQDVDVRVEKEGFQPVTVHVRSKPSAEESAADLAAGGLVVHAVNSAVGSNRDLQPNPVTVVLVPTALIPRAGSAGAASGETVDDPSGASVLLTTRIPPEAMRVSAQIAEFRLAHAAWPKREAIAVPSGSRLVLTEYAENGADRNLGVSLYDAQDRPFRFEISPTGEIVVSPLTARPPRAAPPRPKK